MLNQRYQSKKFSFLLVSTNNNPRYTALKAVNSVIIDSKSLSSFKFQIESRQDNALAKMLSYGLIRNYLSIAQIIEKKLKKPFKSKDRDIFNIIALGVYQILFTKIPPHASINETVKLASLVDKIWSKSLVNAILEVSIEKNRSIINSQLIITIIQNGLFKKLKIHTLRIIKKLFLRITRKAQ